MSGDVVVAVGGATGSNSSIWSDPGPRHRHPFAYNIVINPDGVDFPIKKTVDGFVDDIFKKASNNRAGIFLARTGGGAPGLGVASRDTSDGKQALWCDKYGRLMCNLPRRDSGMYTFSSFDISVSDLAEMPEAISGYTHDPTGHGYDTGPRIDGYFYETRLWEKWLLWAENARIRHHRLDLSQSRHGWYKATAGKTPGTMTPGHEPEHRPFKYPSGPNRRLSIVRNSGIHAPYEDDDLRSEYTTDYSWEYGRSDGVVVLEGSVHPDHLGEPHRIEGGWVVPWTWHWGDADDEDEVVGWRIDWSTYPGVARPFYWNPVGHGPSSECGPDIFRLDLFTHDNLLPGIAFDMILELKIYKYEVFERYEANEKKHLRIVGSGYFNTNMELRGQHLLPLTPKTRVVSGS